MPANEGIARGDGDSDARLLAAIAGGDIEALGPLLTRHHVAVHRYVVRRVGVSDAEDVVSETFEAACRSAGSYRATGESALPWLLGIATNLLHGHARREAAMYRAYARTGVDPATASIEDHPRLDDGSGRVIAGVLAKMRAQHRDAFLLFALGDLSYAEIAESMNVPLGTVKGWVHRARTDAARQLAAAKISTVEEAGR